MKRSIITILFFVYLQTLFGQVSNMEEGSVSYISNVHVYVKFANTGTLREGDTISMFVDGKYVPSLIVKKASTVSCVTTPMDKDQKFKIGDKVAYAPNSTRQEETVIHEVKKNDQNQVISNVVTPDSNVQETAERVRLRKQSMSGRFTASTNASISDSDNNYQRMRLAMSFNVNEIGGSGFSVQNYITYRHRYGVDQSNIGFYDDFKIYALNISYSADSVNAFSLGRKINNRISNMGAIDGFQYERRMGKMVVGALAGSRPDYTNYTFNPTLFQIGAYVSHEQMGKNGLTQSSLAIVEQQNNSKTDRRFAYFSTTIH